MVRRSSWLLAVLVAFVAFLAYASPADAVTQTYNGDLVQMTIMDTGRPDIRVKPSTASGPGDPYVKQYYGSSGNSWGSVIWLNTGGSWAQYGTGYVGGNVVPVSNTTTAVPGGTEIVTVVDLGTSGVRMTQRFTHLTGERVVSKEWTFTNNGATNFSAVRLYHGGDTFFGGEDSAYGFYDATKSMVYVRNTNYASWGLMGFYANPATPASRYYEGSYSTGNLYAGARTDLPNTVEARFVDAGYYLQWDHATLAPGASWIVQAYEIWTPGGALQIVAPGNQNTLAGSTVTLPFTVQNLGSTSLSLTLGATSSRGWTTSVVGGNSLTVPGGGVAIVNVQVVVPEGVTGNNTVTLSASGGATASAGTTLSVVDVGLDISPSSVDFGSWAPGGFASRVVTLTNTGASSLTLGTVTASSPFGKTADNCSGVVLAAGESRTVTAVFSPGVAGSFNGILSVPVVSPVLVTSTVSLSGSASSNTAPTVNLGSDTSVLEGSTFSRSGSYTDPDLNTWTATVDYGDGSGEQSLFLDWDKSFDLSHVYADNGTYTVTVRVSDGSLAGSDSLQVTVNNVAPTVNAGAGTTIAEGATLARSGSFTDPGADTHTATVDYGDGNGEETLVLGPGKTFSLSHAYSDNGTYTVTVAITDDDGGKGTGSFVVTVNNVAPSVDAGPDQTISEGTGFSSAGFFTDPGADTHTATIDYGDGKGASALALAADGSFTIGRQYGDNGTYTVTVRVTDDDGGIGSDSLAVTVTNVSPALEVSPGGMVTYIDRGTFFLTRTGATVGMRLGFSDPGSDDVTVQLAAGGSKTFLNDPSRTDPAQSPGGIWPFSGTFDSSVSYGSPGVFKAQFNIQDDDGGRGSAGPLVVVRGVESEKRDVAYWLARYGGIAPASNGATASAAERTLLEGYLEVASYFGLRFGNEILRWDYLVLADAADAVRILSATVAGTGRPTAEALLLANWLNFACGAQDAGTHVDTDGDGKGDLAFILVIDEAERLLLARNAGASELARACGLLRACLAASAAPPAAGFTDLPEGHPYREAILGLAASGVVTGFADGSFRPDAEVTRQQFAKMIAKALGLEVTGQESCRFTDVARGQDSTDPLYPLSYVAVCAAQGITLGKTSTTFAPYAPITRQQLISMVARAAACPDPSAGFQPPFTRGQFGAAEHFVNAARASAAGLLGGLVGVGPGYEFSATASRAECAQLLWSLLGQTQ